MTSNIEVEDVLSVGSGAGASLASGRSTRSSNRAQARQPGMPNDGEYFQLDLTQHCGKVFHWTSTSGVSNTYVCFNKEGCQRKHRSQQYGEDHHYFRCQKSYGGYVDGLYETMMGEWFGGLVPLS